MFLDKSSPLQFDKTCFGLLKRKKIDYFISHSWSDNIDVKINKLTEFSKTFYTKHLRYPTFWIDTVCIDQTDVLKGVSVLPINVGACDKMLIVMSKTYLTRLWYDKY